MFTRFTVAVDRPVKSGEEKQADFINIVAWNQTAEFICKYFSKGQRIALTGSIRTGDYTDKDGKKHYTFDVWVSNVEFCESRKQGGTSADAHTQEPQKPVESRKPQEPIQYDNDLPF